MCDHPNSEKGECHCKVERVPNFAQPRLLLELAKKPAHGYELIERLGQEGSASPDPGNFYRILRSLEEEGLVCSTWDTPNTGPAPRSGRPRRRRPDAPAAGALEGRGPHAPVVAKGGGAARARGRGRGALRPGPPAAAGAADRGVDQQAPNRVDRAGQRGRRRNRRAQQPQQRRSQPGMGWPYP